MAINIPRLLPIVRAEFPKAPLGKLLKAMADFSRLHPNLTDEQAIQAFQIAMQKSKQPRGNFNNLLGSLPTGA